MGVQSDCGGVHVSETVPLKGKTAGGRYGLAIAQLHFHLVKTVR